MQDELTVSCPRPKQVVFCSMGSDQACTGALAMLVTTNLQSRCHSTCLLVAIPPPPSWGADGLDARTKDRYWNRWAHCRGVFGLSSFHLALGHLFVLSLFFASIDPPADEHSALRSNFR